MSTQAERQRRKARKAARQRKRKQKREAQRTVEVARDGDVARRIAEFASWPIHEAWIRRGWEEPCELVYVVVSRRGPGGRLAAATFLMDLACLGAKNGFVSLLRNEREYRSFCRRLVEMMPMQRCEPSLAGTVVRAGIAYARGLGFEPHPDAESALPLLGEPEDSDVEVPVGGPEGCPHYFAGPDDDAPAIIARLRTRLGPGGFHFTAPAHALGLDPELGDDEPWIEWEEEEEEENDDEIALLVQFADPLFETESETRRNDVGARLRLAAAVWNAVVEDQQRGTTGRFRAVRDAVLRETRVDQGALRVLLETLRERKLQEFGGHRVLYRNVEVTGTRSRGYEISLETRAAASEAGG